MLWKLLTVALTLALVSESVYILIRRHPTNRFRPIEEFGSGVVALDTGTGQLCKTLRTEPLLASQHPGSSSHPIPEQSSSDPVINEINRTSKEEADESATLEFVSKLPACADIR
jgi:hypothetical protein